MPCIVDKKGSTSMVDCVEPNLTDAAFTALYRKEFTGLIRHLVYRGCSFEEAAEAAQEAMIEVWRRYPKIAEPRAYMRRVAGRIASRARQAGAQERHAHQRAVGLFVQPIQLDEETDHVLALVRQLPAAQQEVMAWTIDGFSPKEIASFTGQQPATVRSHLRHARRSLMELLTRHSDVAPQKEERDGP